MFKILPLLLCLLMNIGQLQAQHPSFNWVSQLGGPASDLITKIKHDSLGNQYVVGVYTGEIQLGNDTTLQAAHANKIAYFVAKYAPDGQLSWALSLENQYSEAAHFILNDLYVEENGAFTVAGFYSNLLILEEDTLQTTYLDNIFYGHFSASGELLWLRESGAEDKTEQAYGVARDGVGNFYFTGMSANYSDNPDSSGHPVALVLKVDSAGEEVWRRESTQKEGGLSFEEGAEGREIRIDSAGNVVVLGAFNQYLSWGDSVFTTANFPAQFLAQFNAAGNLQWINKISTDPNAGLYHFALELDRDGNSYVTGSFNYYVEYRELRYNRDSENNQETAVGSIYVLKVSPEGEGRWINGIQDPVNAPATSRYFANARALLVNEANRIFISGAVVGDAVAFDDFIIVPDTLRPRRFIAEISPEGNWAGVMLLDGNEDQLGFLDVPNALSTDLQGNLLYSSVFEQPVQLGEVQLNSRGAVDVFLASIDSDSLFISLPQQVVAFKLVGIGSDSSERVLGDGDQLHLDSLPAHYTIVALVNVPGVGSVRFELNDLITIDNEAPFALAGDSGGGYLPMAPFQPGAYTLIATPYQEDSAGGTAGLSKRIQFEVVGGASKQFSFTIIDARRDADVHDLEEGDVLYQNELPARLNIRANVLGQEPVGSVKLQLDNRPPVIENSDPYSLGGDTNGDYHALMPRLEIGVHTIYATAYSLPNAGGIAGETEQITFELRRSRGGSSAVIAEVAAQAEIVAYPNPFSTSIDFQVSTPKTGIVVLELYDLQGRLVQKLFAAPMEAGAVQTITLHAGSLANGLYIARLITGDAIKHQRIVLSR